MKPHFEKIIANTGSSFRLFEYQLKRFAAPWHFHPEMELTLIVKSSGRRFVGDNLEPFHAGDFVLLGPNLPHFWHNDPKRRHASAQAVVAQFAPQFPAAGFIELPEATRLKRLFARANRGLVFSGARANEAAELFKAASKLNGLAALIRLLAVLELLVSSKARPLTSPSFSPRTDLRSEKRLSRVYSFLMKNFSQPIQLAQVARVAAMTPEGFSRYFKQAVGENFSVTLNRLRVDAAARQLVDSDDKIADVAFATGFSTLSNFNRRFLEIKGQRPREFRRQFRATD